MRRFLIAFVCLSTIALLQNVVVATPAHSDETPAAAADRAQTRLLAAPPQRPDAPTLMLLVAGLSGLAAVGGRSEEQAGEIAS